MPLTFKASPGLAGAMAKGKTADELDAELESLEAELAALEGKAAAPKKAKKLAFPKRTKTPPPAADDAAAAAATQAPRAAAPPDEAAPEPAAAPEKKSPMSRLAGFKVPKFARRKSADDDAPDDAPKDTPDDTPDAEATAHASPSEPIEAPAAQPATQPAPEPQPAPEAPPAPAPVEASVARPPPRPAELDAQYDAEVWSQDDDGAWVRVVAGTPPRTIRRILDEDDNVVREEEADAEDAEQAAGAKAERGVGKLFGSGRFKGLRLRRGGGGDEA